MKLKNFIYSEVEFFTWKWSIILFIGTAFLSIVCGTFQMIAYGEYVVPELLKIGIYTSFILETIRMINSKIFTGRWLGY
ncbi:MAG: hypothetical protein LBI71_04215 [Enterobacteriaceae bacterium]|nr:hypothetical protein [Enterobacteriaceae bacterium]